MSVCHFLKSGPLKECGLFGYILKHHHALREQVFSQRIFRSVNELWKLTEGSKYALRNKQHSTHSSEGLSPQRCIY